MAQPIPGPLVYEEGRSSSNAREMFGGLPPSIVDILDWSVFYDDFNGVAVDDVTANDEVKWTRIVDTGCTVVIEADTQHGFAHFTCDSGDNEGGSIQANETFKLTAGKKLIFEARFLMTDADDGDIAVGLAENHATNPEAMILGAGIWFQVNEGSGALLAKCGTAGAQSLATGVTLTDAAAVRAGFVYDGQSTVKCYVNRVYVGAFTSGLPTTEMTPSAYYINGAGDTDSMKLDYIFAAAER